MDIIRRALKVVDELIVAVALDSTKKPLFDLKVRSSLVRSDAENFLEPAERERLQVKSFSGLLMKFAEKEKASIIFRGLRAISDFEYEVQLACLNAKLAPDIETVFLPASENMQFISSRVIKEIARLKGDVSSFVSPKVTQELEKLFG